MIPCLRKQSRYGDYVELVRDRDKDWMQNSGRKIRKKVLPQVSNETQSGTELGSYRQNQGLGPLAWTSIEGSEISMQRRQRIYRTSMVISETRCIVTIYGVGIQGRLISGQPSLISIDCYSIWNSQMCQIEISDKEVKNILIMAGEEQLLNPGHKLNALRFLLKLLYFRYTVVAQRPTNMDEESGLEDEQERMKTDLKKALQSRKSATYYFDRTRRKKETFLDTWAKGYFTTLLEYRIKYNEPVGELEIAGNKCENESVDTLQSPSERPHTDKVTTRCEDIALYHESYLRPCSEGAYMGDKMYSASSLSTDSKMNR